MQRRKGNDKSWDMYKTTRVKERSSWSEMIDQIIIIVTSIDHQTRNGKDDFVTKKKKNV